MTGSQAPGAPHRLDPPAAPTIVVAGAVASGLVAALVLPGSPVGLGLFLVTVAVTATVAAARPRRVTPEMVGYSVIGLGLAAMTMVRAAEWVLAVDALYAMGLASLVVVGGSTWDRMVRAPLVVLARVPASLAALEDLLVLCEYAVV